MPVLGQEVLVPCIINNTFYNNNAELVGGVVRLNCEFNIPIIFNSIFWENQAPDGKDIYTGAANMTISYSDIDTDSISGTWNGEENINLDPEFVNPGEGNYSIDSCDSPCVGAGIDSLYIENYGWYYAPDYDILGRTRPMPMFDQPDMGAYEVDSCNVVQEVPQISSFKFQISIYPNPSIGISQINYNVTADCRLSTVDLRVYDMKGDYVKTLVKKTHFN